MRRRSPATARFPRPRRILLTWFDRSINCFCREKTQSWDALLAEVLSAALLVPVPASVVVRPWGWPEAVVAVPAAAGVIGTRAIALEHARDEAARLGPVGDRVPGGGAGAGRTPRRRVPLARVWQWGVANRQLLYVFLAASAITAVLSLDATVVLLTPVGLIVPRTAAPGRT